MQQLESISGTFSLRRTACLKSLCVSSRAVFSEMENRLGISRGLDWGVRTEWSYEVLQGWWQVLVTILSHAWEVFLDRKVCFRSQLWVFQLTSESLCGTGHQEGACNEAKCFLTAGKHEGDVRVTCLWPNNCSLGLVLNISTASRSATWTPSLGHTSLWRTLCFPPSTLSSILTLTH